MTEIESITDDAGYERAQVRIGQLFNNCANDEEVAELRALAAAVAEYAETHFEFYWVQTDGADHIEFLLDQEIVTLDELLPVFGGMEPFVEFMTRKRTLDADTLDALVAEFDVRREDIDRPFCQPPGWKGITLEDATCCDDDPCPMGIGEWRERLLAYRARPLTGIDRIGQDRVGIIP